ncbi:MAG TPA: hypothetical protein VJ201_08590 [Candidatus Babeliales bacterium]|nr:hypothetical protein [Candidatus Babeliales bacterium]
MKKLISYYLIFSFLIICFSTKILTVKEITQAEQTEQRYLITTLINLKKHLRNAHSEEERERLQEAIKALSKYISR